MKKELLFVVVAMLFVTTAFSQTLRPADLVTEAKQNFSTTSLDLFERVPSSTFRQDLQEYAELELQETQIEQVLSGKNKLIELTVPISQTQELALELVEVDIYQGNSHVITEPGMNTEFVSVGKHYRGIVRGENETLVSLSFFDGEIMGLISRGDENFVIGKTEDSGNHIVYSDRQLNLSSECGTPDDGVNYSEQELFQDPTTTAALSDCVKLYIEVDYDIYQDKGSTQAVTNYVTGLMNQVITIYANENINTSLSPLVIWTQTSPYSSTSSSGMLSDFQNYRNSFDGDLGQLLSYQASGGIAAGFAGLCASNTDDKQSFSSISSTYSNYPTYSYSVFVVAHEYGHTFGSRHTHACVWNGNGTAIDSCAGYVEGSCSQPGNPSGGGTIMSYCANTSVGIDMTQGFGPQPGNVIRNRVTNASCLSACDGGGGDGGGNDTCVDGELTLTLNFDNYPEETSWNVKNGSGTTVASGGTYGSQADGSTLSVPINLDADGSYTFTINDSYGDGICCSYGNGSFTLVSSDGTSIATGSNFGSSQATSFCVENDGQTADTEAPTAPTNLTASNTTQTTTTLTWNASSDNVGVTGYNIYSGGNNIGSTSGTSANITGLTAATTYSFYVTAVDEAGNESGQSNTVSVTTLSDSTPPVTYCDSKGNNSSYEWIDLVRVGGIDNATGSDGGYGDYTSLSGNLTYGNNSLNVSAGFSGTTYREYWSVWIDYNQDGTFSTDERAVNGSASSAGTLSATINVPTSAKAGVTRMRVSMKYGSAPSPCETFNYGEVEDYTVVIGNSYVPNTSFVNAEVLENKIVEDFLVYPNPAPSNGQFTVEVADIPNGEYMLVNTFGKVVQRGVIANGRTMIQPQGIPAGVYILKVSDDNRGLTKTILVQ